MSESIKNIFINHLGHIREDICGSSKKNQSETNIMEFNSEATEKAEHLQYAQKVLFSTCSINYTMS